MEKTWFYSTKPSQNDWWQCQQREKWEYQNKLFSSMTALVLTTTTFTLERKKIFGSFFTATNELLLGLVDEKLTSFQYPLAFFASIPHYRSTPLREVSISMGMLLLFVQKCVFCGSPFLGKTESKKKRCIGTKNEPITKQFQFHPILWLVICAFHYWGTTF